MSAGHDSGSGAAGGDRGVQCAGIVAEIHTQKIRRVGKLINHRPEAVTVIRPGREFAKHPSKGGRVRQAFYDATPYPRQRIDYVVDWGEQRKPMDMLRNPRGDV